MKAVVAAFNQEKALVGAFSVITNLRMELFEALDNTQCGGDKELSASFVAVMRNISQELLTSSWPAREWEDTGWKLSWNCCKINQISSHEEVLNVLIPASAMV